MKSIKVCEYSRSRSFHDDLILQDQASGERSQDQWSSGIFLIFYPKYRLWVLIRIASLRRFLPTINVLSKYIKNINISDEIFNF